MPDRRLGVRNQVNAHSSDKPINLKTKGANFMSKKSFKLTPIPHRTKFGEPMLGLKEPKSVNKRKHRVLEILRNNPDLKGFFE
mgnify:CR=1 FL=1